MIKTKTIATLGPASSAPEVLQALLEAGVDVVRLNYAHGTLEEHARALACTRELAARQDRAVAVLGDLAGPKIRIGMMDPQDRTLISGSTLVIQRQPILGTSSRLSTTHPGLIDQVAVGDRVLIDDGQILLTVCTVSADQITCYCSHGGLLSDHKGVNLPDSDLAVPALTDKDLRDLQWSIDHEVDYLALSFVRHPQDLRMLRERLRAAGSDIGVVAKIEKPQAVEHIQSIIEEADAVLVARGDLAVEMDHARVPALQKDITVRCLQSGKPVIIATQMLQSMVDSPTPTRAEVSDVANAILDSADAVLLSSETSVGHYPVEAVHWIQRTAAATEAYHARLPPPDPPQVHGTELEVTAAIAQCARTLARRLNPPLAAVWTHSGSSARLLSKHRFDQPIIALTQHPRTLGKLALYYGVRPVLATCPQTAAEMLQLLDGIVLQRGWAQPGDAIIVVAGTQFALTGGNNTLTIHRVGA